ncbi:bifunctional UDP-N-acetylglucosamine diphosphorylase/glucosamine-1-phosphate N-acetyltransferase GlmU [Rhodovulum sp. 12E13]|uniref:bifunctional UDP-N-acetylglucosamine diphosphorylase/glucosamine-1-phosphate N-acetyltransferase GlmU n=1 Tax=Rhodovulum sp. 12E13 TaxID=2203891 RepID=UPI000E131C74|nr:bifunctional UDP-N-acetylglucosamine diphosphorylase/glucosamine-1-phosphate N-acetyltransferase GlmU [Rhodovulum sp. 12E13]RDC71941.1 bifunctional UDP-N-acetylglucosamine diphosphorylase/glucosamine-1-phosphate N-acetyltransferase GlmU [Rhodovulum sp. 12E13]
MALQLVVLAAGEGTRMLSDRPKVLHEVAHAPLLHHALRAGLALGPARVALVVGHGGAAVGAAAREIVPEAAVVTQEERLGTAHAVSVALPEIAGAGGDTLVLYADTPFLREETLSAMQAARAQHDVVVLGFEAADPGRYGRLVQAADGTLERIVEWKDATEAERAVRLCNSGVICCATALLEELLPQIGNANASGEYYLTDIVGLARAGGLSCGVVRCDEAETLGVNSRADLARAEAAFQARARAGALETGATLTAPETVHFAHDTVLGRDVEVEPMVVFGPGVTVETGARIRAFSHLEGCHVSAGAVIGPYARLRPGAEIGEDARIGNFVEVKAAEIGAGAKVNHLTYIGDAEVGAGANIGAGTVTCNYDGVSKHRTVIGERAFIGSDTMLVAPVRVGAEAVTGSGSVVTRDVEAGALALGRARQETRPGLGRRLMERLRAARAERG